MIKKALVEYCAPTLAGIKTGNIFSIKNGKTDIYREIRKLNGILVGRGFEYKPASELCIAEGTEAESLIKLL